MKTRSMHVRVYMLIRKSCRVIEALFFLVVVHHMLRSRGFGPTHRVFVDNAILKAPKKILSASEVAAGVTDAVVVADLVNPNSARCLQRSLVIYRMLMRRGVPAQFCIGVGYISLRPHAWVNCAGKKIDTIRNNQKGMVLLHSNHRRERLAVIQQESGGF